MSVESGDERKGRAAHMPAMASGVVSSRTR